MVYRYIPLLYLPEFQDYCDIYCQLDARGTVIEYSDSLVQRPIIIITKYACVHVSVQLYISILSQYLKQMDINSNRRCTHSDEIEHKIQFTLVWDEWTSNTLQHGGDLRYVFVRVVSC